MSDKHIRYPLLIPSGVEAILISKFELLDDTAKQQPHFLHGNILADAVVRAERERNEGVRVVHEISRAFFQIFSDEPTVGPERFRTSIVTSVPVDRPEVYACLGAFWNNAKLEFESEDHSQDGRTTYYGPIIRPPVPISGAR